MALDYAIDKFDEALANLANSPGRIQERLTDAFKDSLMYVEVDEDIPESHKPSFYSLMEKICLD